jgi:uncharacterized membrane protein
MTETVRREAVNPELASQAKQDQRGYRLTSIDMLRGLVILVMALDHVRDFNMIGGVQDPMTDPNVSPWLFFTRWITHFCAPVFVFLAGTSAGLMEGRKSPRELGLFLLKRGLWIILVEVTLISTAFTFSPGGIAQFNGQTLVLLQVMWAIGASMVILAFAQRLGSKACLWIGAFIISAHNLLDPFWPQSNLFNNSHPIWVGLHAQMGISGEQFLVVVGYPLIPWFAVMMLGYGMAGIFRKSPAQRDRQLLLTGLAAVLAFMLLRALDFYGEPKAWHPSPNGALYTVMSFLNTSKYPPSLDYLLMTLGPAAILCSCADRLSGWFKDMLVMFGRVPFAFYVAHFYLAHLLAVAIGMAQGFGAGEMAVFFPFKPQGAGVGLGGVYLVWLCMIAMLYPFCRWVAGVKARRSDWWLSYL